MAHTGMDDHLSAPRSIGRALNFAASTGSAVANALLAPHGLSLAQWVVLVSIWKNGPLAVKQISTLTGNAPPATSRIVDRMVQNGLLLRRPDTRDRRAVVVDLSERGEELRPLLGIYEQVNDVLLADLPSADRARLFELLEQVEGTGKAWLDANGPQTRNSGDS